MRPNDEVKDDRLRVGMRPKEVYKIALWLVVFDILAFSATMLSRFVFSLTPVDALKTIYLHKESVSSAFLILLIFGLLLLTIAWTLVLSRKKVAIGFYVTSLVLMYFPSILFIWVINGVEFLFEAIRLVVAGALLYHLTFNDIEAREEEPEKDQKQEKDKKKKAKDDREEERKRRLLGDHLNHFHDEDDFIGEER